MEIIMIRTDFEMKQGSFVEVSKSTDAISETTLNNIVDSCKFYRRLGGSETLTKSYTCRGYMPVKLTSKSPDKRMKIVREFQYE
jgi:hypothetical protein